MKLDISVHKGGESKPAVILIHGLGMDKNIWIDPLNTKVFARNIPLKVFAAAEPQHGISRGLKKISFGRIPEKVDTIWSALRKEKYNIVCWSQKRPVGPIHSAVDELGEVVKRTGTFFPKSAIVLVGHSRGGLIARKFMECRPPGIKALITVSTPNSGSAIAGLVRYLKPCSTALKRILPENTHSAVSSIVKNIAELLDGKAVRELLPGSAFFENLEDSAVKGVKYISFGGTEPRFLTAYIRKGSGDKMYLKASLSIPDSLLKIFPSSFVMDEITPGKGDGLVTAKSSLMPWSSKHYNLSANHLSILWARKTISGIMGAIRSI